MFAVVVLFLVGTSKLDFWIQKLFWEKIRQTMNGSKHIYFVKVQTGRAISKTIKLIKP